MKRKQQQQRGNLGNYLRINGACLGPAQRADEISGKLTTFLQRGGAGQMATQRDAGKGQVSFGPPTPAPRENLISIFTETSCGSKRAPNKLCTL